MAGRGAQPGNTNATKNRPWQAAIMRAIRKRSRTDRLEELDRLAEKLIEHVEAGDLVAIKEFGDRVDGKPSQALTGADGGPVQVQAIERVIVDPKE